jgi:group I intron endonuclease
MKTYIYILIDPETNQVRYIGKTKSLKRRYNQHISECSKLKSHKNNWLLSLKNKNLKPEMVVIDETDKDDWISLEQWYIQLYRSWGYKLTNLTAGGEGVYGHSPSQETREKMSRANKGRVVSEETKRKLSVTIKGRKMSDETKRKVSEAAKKRGISPETQAKMIESRRKNPLKHSEESKLRISQKLKLITNDRQYKNNRVPK